MNCCTQTTGVGRFFSRFASSNRRRYQKKGFSSSQKHLISGLKQLGFNEASVLEIGCGVGYLHQSLLDHGASRATGIDLSEGMIHEARAVSKERHLEGRTEYIQGNFVDLAGGLARSDITILDKVVCCYPDAASLLKTSIEKTSRVYALTYPRDRWFLKLFSTLAAWVLKLIGSQFRGYIHDPEKIEFWITERGFIKSYENQTMIWLTQVYEYSNPKR